MKHKRRKRKHPKKHKKHGGISFLLAIIGNLFIGGICLITFLTLFHNYLFDNKIWAVFATGFVGALAIVGSSAIPRTRTLIHETKHALVVVLTGNLIKSFHVGKGTGHVGFEMYSDKLRFAPIISLAPYFFPLFSLPTWVVCLVLEEEHKLPLALALGVTLAIDLATAYGELHPHQSDLKKITGGFLVAALYLAGFHFMWVMICLLWITAGRNAYVYTGYVLWSVVLQLAARIRPYLEG